MEIIEVIDTAIKIGLGALITGTATYLLANRNYKYDLKKKSIENNVTLLKELSIKLEHAEAFLNETSHSYLFQAADKPFDATPFISAQKLLYEARAMANLLGKRELTEQISALSEVFEKMYNELFKTNNHSTLSSFVKSIDDKKKEIYPLITEAYTELT